MLRVLLVIAGITVLAVLAAAVHHDPHAWGHLLTALSRQAQQAGTHLDARVRSFTGSRP